MNLASGPCDLCGLPLHYGAFSSVLSNKTYRFCCMGCKQVFTMLFEASDEADPASFKETELFKKCQEMGIIPRSKADLEQQAQTQESATSYPSTHRDIGSLDTQGEISDENALGLNLVVTDMWCPACAWVIEEALKRSSGVTNASCNFSTDRVLCEYDPVSTSPSHIIRTIDALGYKASIPGKEDETAEKKRDVEFLFHLLLNYWLRQLRNARAFFECHITT